MYFLDIDILIRQLLPPSWRRADKTDGGKMDYLNAVLSPFKQLFRLFFVFQEDTKKRVNLSAQVIVIENYIEEMIGVRYGVFLSNDVEPNHFFVNIPKQGILKEKEIMKFLKKIVPIGRCYQIKFY